MKLRKLAYIVGLGIFSISLINVNFNNYKKTYADSTELILDGSGLSSTATSKATTITSDGIDYVFSSGAKKQSSAGENKFSSDAILIGKSGAYIYNSTPIPGNITKFEIYANKGASAKVSIGVMFSDTAITSYNGSGSNVYTATLATVDSIYNCSSKLSSSCKYFWYQVTNANNSQVEFRITYSDVQQQKLSAPTNVVVANDGTLTFTANDSNATSYEYVAKDGENQVATGNAVSGSTKLPINKSGSYSVVVTAKAEGFASSDSESYNWVISEDNPKIVTTTEFASETIENKYFLYKISAKVTAVTNSTYGCLKISDGTTEIEAYDVLPEKGATTSNGFNTNDKTKGIIVGDDIILIGPKSGDKLNYPWLVSFAHDLTTSFTILDTQACLLGSYTYQPSSSAVLINSDFSSDAKSDTDLPNGWTSDKIGGTYDDPFWQSFRDNGQYILSNAFVNTQSKLNVTFVYYLNNTGTTKNRSSKIRIEGVSSTDTVVATFTTGELNDNPTGLINARTINTTIEGENISKVKISLLKDGGGNIAFSKVSIYSDENYEITKVNGKNQIALQFAGIIPASVKNILDENYSNISYGMIYGKSSSFGGDSIKDVVNSFLNSGYSLNDLKELNISSTVENSDDLNGSDETGKISVNENPSYYTVGISLKNISNNNLSTLVKAAAYVCLDGTYYIMSEKEYSVKTIAQTYLDGRDVSSYINAIGFLNYLANI